MVAVLPKCKVRAHTDLLHSCLSLNNCIVCHKLSFSSWTFVSHLVPNKVSYAKVLSWIMGLRGGVETHKQKVLALRASGFAMLRD